MDLENTAYLNISGALSAKRPLVVLVGTAVLDGLKEFGISEIDLNGEITINCKPRKHLLLLMDKVTMRSNNVQRGIRVTGCSKLNSFIKNSTFTDVLMEIGAKEEFEATFVDSSFSGVSKKNIMKPGSGIVMSFIEPKGKHTINVTRCTFMGLGYDLGAQMPSGALTVVTEKDSVRVKFQLDACTFIDNARALDLSLRGTNFIEIRDTVFLANNATGSGGAIRLTATLHKGLGSLVTLKETSINIVGCTFKENGAMSSSVYVEPDPYTVTRAPGSGGAVYVSLPTRTPSHHNGLVTIDGCLFENNTAERLGGALYGASGISFWLRNCTIGGPLQIGSLAIGDLLYGACNMTLADVTVRAHRGDVSAPLISYRALNPFNSRLTIARVHLACPPGHSVETLNATALGYGMETLDIHCRPCPDRMYSLNIAELSMDMVEGIVHGAVSCLHCPYGAECAGGVRNDDGYWGLTQDESSVDMLPCPEDYCEMDKQHALAYNSCAELRAGVLCGRCQDGYSESIFSSDCLSNDLCSAKRNWFLALLFAVYGVLYVLFFMFQDDYARLLHVITSKIKGEEAEKADDAEVGYFQVFMYYIQTSELIQVNIVMETDDLYGYVHRPQDFLPRFIIDGFKEIFSFDLIAFNAKACFFPDVTPVMKIFMKGAFIVYLFSIVGIIFASGSALLSKLRPALNARILMTVLALFLYTYQEVAESSLLLLNCVDVDGQRVLYLDGNVTCLQEWQYGVIILVSVYVIPFFVVLLLAPKLLKEGVISLPFFFMSFLFPLFAAVPVVIMFYRQMRSPLVAVPERCSLRRLRETVVDGVVGPYRQDLFAGICWEGVINFRRMLLVVIFTFVNNIFSRQLALTFGCLVILAVHLRTDAYMHRFTNIFETLTLSLLVLIGMTNVVKATFYQSGAIPRGNGYLVAVIFEWMETVALGVLPLGAAILIISTLVLKTGFSMSKRVIEKVRHARHAHESACDSDDGTTSQPVIGPYGVSSPAGRPLADGVLPWSRAANSLRFPLWQPAPTNRRRSNSQRR